MIGKTTRILLALFILFGFASRVFSTPEIASASSPSAITRTPTPPQRSPTPALNASGLPPSAEVEGMWGYGQLLGLSCESRSAADWARHFGIDIRELKFLAALPRSNNPEVGFVGSPKGGWGGIPPDDYGVHAGPVARLLREGYGAHALAVRNMTFERLRREIAADRPVIVWVTGHVEPGKGTAYKVDGQTITVARYEHTVIVIGYDGKNVQILDGKKIYKRPIETFLKAWSPLENMAVVWDEPNLGRIMERGEVKENNQR